MSKNLFRTTKIRGSKKAASLLRQSASRARDVRKKAGKKREVSQRISPLIKSSLHSQREKEAVEEAKFTTVLPVVAQEIAPRGTPPALPARYYDDRIILLSRDPWWIHTYWDISEGKINKVVSSLPVDERQNLKWILRVYDVSGVKDFEPNNAHSFFDVEIALEASNWYINVDQPEREWCVEIGLRSPLGHFFPVARSNIIKTPCFGISSLVDEEWVLPDEEYFKILGVYDLGKSSLEIKKKFEEIFKQQISSPLASWGVSSLFSERAQVKDKFFLKVWTELILYGITEPDAEVTVEGKRVKLRKDGTFSLRYALPEGKFEFNVIGTSKNKKHRIEKTPAVKRYSK